MCRYWFDTMSERKAIISISRDLHFKMLLTKCYAFCFDIYPSFFGAIDLSIVKVLLYLFLASHQISRSAKTHGPFFSCRVELLSLQFHFCNFLVFQNAMRYNIYLQIVRIVVNIFFRLAVLGPLRRGIAAGPRLYHLHPWICNPEKLIRLLFQKSWTAIWEKYDAIHKIHKRMINLQKVNVSIR